MIVAFGLAAASPIVFAERPYWMACQREAIRQSRDQVEIPPLLDLLPMITWSRGAPYRQPYRVVFIGECRWRSGSASIRGAGWRLGRICLRWPFGQRSLNRAADAELMLLLRWSALGETNSVRSLKESDRNCWSLIANGK